MWSAFQKDNNIVHLLQDEEVQALVNETLPGIRSVVPSAVIAGLAIPAYSAAISYFDTIRSGNMPSNLVQAQRDYFGAHTYELRGQEGFFHTEWNQMPDV